jgi:hypothetical protein
MKSYFKFKPKLYISFSITHFTLKSELFNLRESTEKGGKRIKI